MCVQNKNENHFKKPFPPRVVLCKFSLSNQPVQHLAFKSKSELLASTDRLYKSTERSMRYIVYLEKAQPYF
jgi:hypothetical protein